MKRPALFALILAPLATMSWLAAHDSLVSWIVPGSRATSLEAQATAVRVQPGLVKWHASYEEACAAAKSSSKPVMLFQLLGRLDEKLC